MVEGRFKGRYKLSEHSKKESQKLKDFGESAKSLSGCLDLMEKIFEESLRDGKDIRGNEDFEFLDRRYDALLRSKGKYTNESIEAQARYDALIEKIDLAVHGPRIRESSYVSHGGIRIGRFSRFR